MQISIQLRGLSLATLALSLFSFQPNFALAQSDEFQEEIVKIHREARDSRIVAELLDEKYDYLKHWMDREVNFILRNHPIIGELEPIIESQLEDMILGTRVVHLGRTAQASRNPDQYKDKLVAAEQVAERLGFSPEVIKEMFVGVATGPVNAYTYSGLPYKYLDLVLFSGLIDLLSPEELKGVIAHEMGHVKSKHILNRYLVVMLFLMSGENILDEMEGEIEAEEEELNRRKQEMRERFRVAARESFNRMQKISFFNPFIPAESKIGSMGTAESNNVEFDRLSAMANSLRGQFSKEALQEVTFFLGKTMSAQNEEGAKRVHERVMHYEKAEAPVQLTMEDVISFLESLEHLSNSAETTCDRFAALVVSKEAMEMVSVKLAGGTSRRAIEKQGKKVAEILKKRPDLLEAAHGGSHPFPIHRMGAHRDLQNNRYFQILRNRFTSSLESLNLISQTIANNQADRQSDHMLLRDQELLRTQTDKLLVFESKISAAIRKEVVNQAMLEDANVRPLVTLLRYVTSLAEAEIGQMQVPNRWGLEGGLLFELKKEFIEIATKGKTPAGKELNPKQAAAATFALEDFFGAIMMHDPDVALNERLKDLGLGGGCGGAFEGGFPAL